MRGIKQRWLLKAAAQNDKLGSAHTVARMPRSLKTLFAVLLACSLAGPGMQHAAAAPQETPPRPKLLVILVVDQMRADYITAYGHQWTKGLRRLLDQGAWFTEGAYPYLNTVTCAGHATISTGTVPAVHGMILNSWWNRASGASESCTRDYHTPLVTFGEPLQGGESAVFLRAPTLGQRLRERLGEENARVAAFSRKARSAIMLAGKEADAVAWLAEDGIWATSQAYPAQPFLQTFFRTNSVEKDLRKKWTLSLSRSDYLYKDSAPGERPQPSHWTVRFPHRLRNGTLGPDADFYAAWSDSPFADEYVARMARTAVAALKLGQRDGATDLLAISFATLDAVGHDFGPRSFEVQDTLVRLDATIGKLLNYLDDEVGKGKYTVALSADHGVADVPEQMKGRGEDAGRVPTGRTLEAAMKVLEKHFGEGRHVIAQMYTDFYFADGVYQKLLENPAVLDEVIAAIHSVPGVARVFRGDLLPGLRESLDPLERAAALNYFPGRSADLIVVPKLNWFFVPGRGSSTPATHGTAHPYDTRVPVLLWGAGIRAGKYSQPATPADIAPTLAALAGIVLPEATGRVLHEALAPQKKIEVATPDSLLDSPK